jgi:hypothetical protein
MVIDLEYGWYMHEEGKGLILGGPQWFRENDLIHEHLTAFKD